MKITAAVLHYFRTSPFPVKQPASANRRSDKGENLLSIQFASYLREKTLTGHCRACWTKISNETSSHSFSYGNLMRNMGKLSGIPDFIFTYDKGHLWLELKDGKKGKLTDNQEFFRDWCVETKSNWEIACSLDEAIMVVDKYNIISK